VIDFDHPHVDVVACPDLVNGYMLVYAALLITGGRLGDFYGPRRMLILGILIFVAGSLACAGSQSVAQLIAARVVQGVGGALLTPQTLAFIPMIFPEGRRGAARRRMRNFRRSAGSEANAVIAR